MLKITSSELRSRLGVAFVALLPLTEAAAQVPIWDPAAQNPAFSTSRECLIPVTSTTAVRVVAGPRDASNNPTGAFPVTVTSAADPLCPATAGTCLKWDYRFFYPSGMKPSLVLLAADSNAKVLNTSSSAVVTYPFHTSTLGLSIWDNSINWGNTSTEIGFRMTDNATTYSGSVYTDTFARVGTVTVGYKSGKLGGFCAIQGAHMPLPGDPLRSQNLTTTTTTLGCTVNWTLSPDGCVASAAVDYSKSPATCQIVQQDLVVNGQVATTASCQTEVAGPFGSTQTCQWSSALRRLVCVTVP